MKDIESFNLESFVKQLKKKKHKLSKAELKKLVLARAEALFKQAEQYFKNRNKRLSDRHVRKARNLAMKFRIRLGRELKRRFCRHCKSFLVPGVNCRVRLAKKRVIYFCLECKGIMRLPYSKEKNKRREK